MGRLMCINSGKGGVGKSTFTANIGNALSQNGHSVLIVDTDCGLRSVDLLLGGGEQVIYDLGDLIENRCKVPDAIVRISSNLCYIAAPQDISAFDNPLQAAKIITMLADKFDFLLIDRCGGLDYSLEENLKNCEHIVIATPEPIALRCAGACAARLRNTDSGFPIMLVLNRVVPKFIKDNTLPKLDSITDSVGAKLLGIIPEDKRIFFSAVKGACPARGGARKAFCRIASRIDGKNIPLPKLNKLI